VGHELGQPSGVQQTGGDTPGESLACASQHGQPSPQGIACRGVRIVGQGIEKEVGQPMTREMFGRRKPRRKYKPV
jgi:hypothetical protein